MVPLERILILNSSVNAVLFKENLYLNIGLLFLLGLLLIASAFFSSTETAYSSVNIIRLRNYMEEKRKGAKKAVYIAEKFDITLTTVLIGNNFVNIFATTIAAYILGTLIKYPTISNLVNTVAMTIIVLIFGEIIPKSYAKENAEKMALKTAGIMYFLIKLLWPITWLFMKLKKSIVKKSEKSTNSPYVTEEELESIIDVMETEGVIDENDAELIQSAISLNDRTVYEIMTPRVDIIAVEVNASIDYIKEIFFEHQFSRVPVYKEDKDNMIGVLSERDFFTALLKNEEINIEKLISKPYFVSKSTKVNDLIKNMQMLKKHFAIVSDEYGGTSGIVTMEDALEELVGEIYDEYDEVEENEIVKVGDNKYLISTEYDLEELFEGLNLGKTPDSKYTSVGGFVYGLCEGLPYEGKVIKYSSVYEEYDIEDPVTIYYDLEFSIKKVENRRIRSIELNIKTIDKE